MLTWSVVAMSVEEPAEDRTADGFRTVDGFHGSVDLDVVTGPVLPCEPVAAD